MQKVFLVIYLDSASVCSQIEEDRPLEPEVLQKRVTPRINTQKMLAE
jgi:hypothetical protein